MSSKLGGCFAYKLKFVPKFVTTCLVVSRFLGTSGQNIDDLDKYSEAKDKLQFMERTLRWRHLAPTAPNTLGE